MKCKRPVSKFLFANSKISPTTLYKSMGPLERVDPNILLSLWSTMVLKCGYGFANLACRFYLTI